MATSRHHHGDIMDSTSTRRVAQGLGTTAADSSSSIQAASITTTTTSGSQQPGTWQQSWHQQQQDFGGQRSSSYENLGWQGNFYYGGHHGQQEMMGFHENSGQQCLTSSSSQQSSANYGSGLKRATNEDLAHQLIGSNAFMSPSMPKSANRLRPHSTPATLCWLEKNYELSEGVCIPRNVVYFNYVDFCNKNGMQPVNAASFGKIIRQMFQSLTTRRLGTRGQSRYHYYGLAVKPDSIYYSPGYSNRKYSRMDNGSQWNVPPTLNLPSGQDFNDSLSHQNRPQNRYSPYAMVMARNGNESKFGCNAQYANVSGNSGGNSGVSATCANGGAFPSLKGVPSGFASVQQLPEFPTFTDFNGYLEPDITEDRFQSLLTMYRAHSQRIMDSVNKFSFVEIPNLFKHFWQELPSHILCFIGHKSIVTFVGVCDKILYATILKAILPTPVQILPEDIMKIVRSFATDLVTSLGQSLKHVPHKLVEVKMKLVTQLSQCLRRRTSVNHLYQAASLVITPNNQSSYECLLAEWQYCNWENIAESCASKCCPSNELLEMAIAYRKHLDDRSNVSEICRWMQNIVRRKTGIKSEAGVDWYSSSKDLDEIVDVCEKLLHSWNCIGEKVFQHIQPQHYPSSPLQFLKILLNELIIHEMEMIISEKTSYQLIYSASSAHEDQSPNLVRLLESLGDDFLTKVKKDSRPQGGLSVKQEVFESSLNESECQVTHVSSNTPQQQDGSGGGKNDGGESVV